MTISKASQSKVQYTTPIDDIPDGPTLSASDVGTSRAFNNGAATITATPAVTGGGSITSYTVTSSPGGYTASGSSPITVTGLESNTSYTFSATATNDKGVSPFSGPASSAITATTVPGAPTVGTATRVSDTVASLTFTPPANNGGKSITGYVIESSPSISITTQAGTSSPLTATGTFAGNSTNYTFTIKAVNDNGTGAASSASNGIALKTTSDSVVVDYLVVAGGASGAGGFGGGGAGGLRSTVTGSGGGAGVETALTLDGGTNYAVTVGAGGTSSNGDSQGGNGSASSFSTITTVGGGGGAHNVGHGANAGSPGGSGGGGAGWSSGHSGGAGTANQGYAGGPSNGGYNSGGGGGGGASAVGGNGGAGGYRYGGDGGAGRAVSITGSSVHYAGGGGGAGETNPNQGDGGVGGGGNASNPQDASPSGYAQPGTANRGGGGGGMWGGPHGGQGGSGVVILRYPSANTITLGAGLTGSTTTVGGNKVTTITAGSGNVSWS